jgi:hypothetical protein
MEDGLDRTAVIGTFQDPRPRDWGQKRDQPWHAPQFSPKQFGQCWQRMKFELFWTASAAQSRGHHPGTCNGTPAVPRDSVLEASSSEDTP